MSLLPRSIVTSAVLLGLSLCLSRVEAQEAPRGTSRWEEAIQKFEQQDAEQPPQPGGVVFVGSSSIRLWDLKANFPDLNAINRGFGGSQLGDLAHFAERILLAHRPRLVVVYAGDNDLAAGKTPEQVLADYERLAAFLHERLPETRMVYIGVKPSLARWKLIEQVRQTNQMIAQRASQDERLAFVDIDAPMIGPDGLPRKKLFRDDGLHLNDEGYAVWAEQLRSHLEP